MAVVVDKDACVGCESCLPVCPVEAISMDGGEAVIDQVKCTKCEACVGECPVEAIKVG